jgi:hypothetical protein
MLNILLFDSKYEDYKLFITLNSCQTKRRHMSDYSSPDMRQNPDGILSYLYVCMCEYLV